MNIKESCVILLNVSYSYNTKTAPSQCILYIHFKFSLTTYIILLYFKIVNTIILKASQAQSSLYYNMTVLVFAMVLCLAAFTVKAQDCTALANAGKCDFYT